MTKFDPGGIKIIGTDKYEEDVEGVLNGILKNPAGSVLLNFIDANEKYIRIVPYTGGGCQALAKPDNQRDATPENVKPYLGYADGEIATRNARGGIDISSRDDKANWSGTGSGTDVHVNFSQDGSACGKGNFGSKPDEGLFHEMVHAFRQMQGLYNPVPTVAKLFLYLHEEEWLAILIANIYSSAKTQDNKNLRENHNGYSELKYPLNTSDGFLKNQDHLQLVQKYYRQEFYLFLSLSYVKAPYNPISEFFSNLRTYNQP